MSKFNYVKAIRSIQMHPTTKLVAMTLATYADYETGECYPSIQTLVEDTGLSNRVVCLHIKHIEQLGILTADRSNGRRSYYKFDVEALTKPVTLVQEAVTENNQLRKVSGDSQDNSSDFDDSKAVTLVQQPVTLVQEAVTESHTNYQEQPIEQLKEQPEEQSKNKTASKSKTIKTAIPSDFKISDEVRSWAHEKNFDNLEQHLEYFVEKCNANGYKYVKWDSAFKTAIRDDWAKLRSQQWRPQHGSQPQPSQPIDLSKYKDIEGAW